ncbi:ubiquitin-like domain-containing protein [Desulfovirgula thermocuniculi]|uniref:ubiquitin-like domain-containing protein n=1 Tax=Desulfovirgula thermocuniculi TaxID=348842 RepID=UPI0004040B53|nr:ubiquitin-like domain-containing protein [Desulfovirgula thermocuniculi]
MKAGRRLILPLALAATLALCGLAYVSLATKEVTLAADGREVTLKTKARSVADLLRAQRIDLGPQDRVDPPPETPLAGGMRVEVRRAVPVNLAVDGEVKSVLVAAGTVREALVAVGVALGEKDLVYPAADEALRPGMDIRVVRVREEVKEVEVSLPYDTRRILDGELLVGQQKVVQEGRPGKARQRWLLTYHDGQEVSRVMQDSQVLEAPVERVVRVGTQNQVSRGGQVIRFSRVVDAVATAYSYSTGSVTATGAPARYGVVAVDPAVIPLGTRLYIDGYGYATALDVGSHIRGNRIDVFLESEEAARRWGVRRVRVYVLD